MSGGAPAQRRARMNVETRSAASPNRHQDPHRRLAIDAEQLHQPGDTENGAELRQAVELDVKRLQPIERQNVALRKMDAEADDRRAESLQRNGIETGIEQPGREDGQGNVEKLHPAILARPHAPCARHGADVSRLSW